MSPKHNPGQLAPALATIYSNVQAGFDLTRLPGIGLFYSEHSDERHCPTVLAKFVRRLNALPQLSVIVTVRNVSSSKCCWCDCLQNKVSIWPLPAVGLFYSERRDRRLCPVVFVKRPDVLPQLPSIVSVHNTSTSDCSC